MKSASFTLLVLLATVLAVPSLAFAQTNPRQAACEAIEGQNFENGQCTSATDTTKLFGRGGIFETIVEFLLFLTGAVSVLVIIIGAFRLVISGGNSDSTGKARSQIQYAVIGLIVSLVAFAIVNFVLDVATAPPSDSSFSSFLLS